MTIRKHPNQGQPIRRSTRMLGAIVLAGLAIGLAGCGRKGAPEFDSGQPVAKTQTNELVPGLDLPHKGAEAEKPKKPKGNFLLDPLL